LRQRAHWPPAAAGTKERLMHPAAWVAWVCFVMVVALATTNPLYLAVVLLCVVLVAVLAPRTGTGVASFRALALFGVAMITFSVLIATVNGSYGNHILFTIPGPEIPRWLGGLSLGGPVSGEGLVAAAIRGFAILCVFLAFGVFNGAVSPHRVLRSTPAALFHASLVVTVGLTLLPASIEDLRRIREMRALRGARGGIRDLPALVVPAVIGGLERSMRLAEAMEARGYAASPPPPAAARLLSVASVPLLVAGAWAWFYSGAWQWAGAVLGLAGLAALGGWFILAGRAHRTTRLSDEPVPFAQRIAIAASLAGLVAILTARGLGSLSLTYNPFAGLPVPGFSPAGVLLMLICAWPVVFLFFQPAPQPSREPERVLSPEATG